MFGVTHIAMRDQMLISCPTYCQMYAMFYVSSVFNQPLDFDTAEVTNVRYLFESDSNER